MARKYPEWTPEKDQMLLCAAHVHRDAASGFVKWNRVAAVVAQGAHSAKSCCGRHTYLIKNYAEAEKALSQVEDTATTSQVSTPVSSPIKPPKSNKKSTSDTGTAVSSLSAATSNSQQSTDAVSSASRMIQNSTVASSGPDRILENGSSHSKRKNSKKNKKRSSAEKDDGQPEDSNAATRTKKPKQNEKGKESLETTYVTAKRSPHIDRAMAPSTPIAPQALLAASGSVAAQSSNQTRSTSLISQRPYSNSVQRQNTWSVPSYSSRLNSNWYRNRGHRGYQHGNNGEKWVENVVQGFKHELLKGLRRQMGVP